MASSEGPLSASGISSMTLPSVGGLLLPVFLLFFFDFFDGFFGGGGGLEEE